MSNFKSHFLFTKNQRNGIFLLLAFIIAFQFANFFIDFSSEEIKIHPIELQAFQREVDSLKALQLEKNKPKIYPFNPNYITDYKGYSLGMSNEEIDKLLQFRKQDKWINSAKQFQEVTNISDSLLATMSSYFKFPEWVTNPKSKSDWVDYSKSNTYSVNNNKTYAQKADLNKATAEDLQKVNGIGAALSDRIIKYRAKFTGGFISDVQLEDIYGLSPEVVERVTNDFTVKTPRAIKKIVLNTATRDELVTIQHIDYEIAHYIIEQRTLREGFKSLDDLTKVKSFPIKKIEIIKLYLTLN